MGSLPHAVILTSEFPPGPGGIGTHAHQLAVQLVQRGWQVTVLASQDYVDPERIAAFNRAQPFAVISPARTGSRVATAAQRVLAAERLLRRSRPDLLIASGERMVWMGSVLAGAFRVPSVAIGHALEFNVSAPWRRRLNRLAFGRYDHVVCVSEFTRSRLDVLGARPRGVSVIPNGADDGRFRVLDAGEGERFRRERNLVRARLLVTVGGVHQRKGQDLVIRALPEVLRRFPDVHYLIAGMPLEKDRFAAVAAELGVIDRVHFLGVLDPATLLAAVNASDLFVMTSRHTAEGDFEGFGIAVVEAALCGKAAVVTDGSGLVEAIEPGVTGLAARQEDPASIAACINELLADPARLQAMGRAALDRARREQTWQMRGLAYDRLLREVSGRRGTTMAGARMTSS
jgi:phosphatidylinositol alpha-1,6-mannosyltransferase